MISKIGVFPEMPDTSIRYLVAAGEEEDPRGEERADMFPVADMTITSRASYFSSGGLCCALYSAILSGHGY